MEKNNKLTEKNTAIQGIETAQPPEFSAEKPMSLKKELLGLLCLFLALLIFCAATVPVLIPKRHDYGSVWGMYTAEKKNSVDALFFGSSMVYCDVIPSVIYEETGAATFVMAGPEQTYPVTYYYLKESCKTQTPKTVFIEATGLIYGESNRSVKVNLTYMPWGVNRLVPTFTEKLTEGGKTQAETEEMEQNARLGLLFPLYSYHDRWDELNRQDLKDAFLGYETDPLAGYTFLDRTLPITEFDEHVFEESPETYSRNLSYAKKMVDFCSENGINTVFFLSPSTSRLNPDVTAQMQTDLTALGAEFVDFNDDFDEFNFDLSVDFHDTLHTNYRGAEKFSRCLAGKLKDFGVTESQNADTALWQERIRHFNNLRDTADSSPVKLNPGVTPN